jgi:hypothetical protein
MRQNDQAVKSYIHKLQRQSTGKFFVFLIAAYSSLTVTTPSYPKVKECDYQTKGYGFMPGQFLALFTFFDLHILVFCFILLFRLFPFVLCQCLFAIK